MSAAGESRDPTARDIADLIAFLPRLSEPGFKPTVHWGGGEKDENGDVVMPWPAYHSTVQEFLTLAGAECWTDYNYDRSRRAGCSKMKD